MLKNVYTETLKDIINKYIRTNVNTIFVLAGVAPYINLDNFTENITDQSTFDIEGNLDFFDPEWFGGVFLKLNSAITFQILSHQQYASIIEYLNEDFFQRKNCCYI